MSATLDHLFADHTPLPAGMVEVSIPEAYFPPLEGPVHPRARALAAKLYHLAFFRISFSCHDSIYIPPALVIDGEIPWAAWMLARIEEASCTLVLEVISGERIYPVARESVGTIALLQFLHRMVQLPGLEVLDPQSNTIDF